MLLFSDGIEDFEEIWKDEERKIRWRDDDEIKSILGRKQEIRVYKNLYYVYIYCYFP